MQVLEAVVPGSTQEQFIRNHLLEAFGYIELQLAGGLGGYPKSMTRSSIRSRDMLKFGLLTLNQEDGTVNNFSPSLCQKSHLTPGANQ